MGKVHVLQVRRQEARMANQLARDKQEKERLLLDQGMGIQPKRKKKQKKEIKRRKKKMK